MEIIIISIQLGEFTSEDSNILNEKLKMEENHTDLYVGARMGNFR